MTRFTRSTFDFATAARVLAPSDATAGAASELGDLPEWNLADLYSSPDAPEVETDLAAASKAASSIKEKFQGKFDEVAKDGAKLAEAIKAYEALSDTLGKLGSFAGLL